MLHVKDFPSTAYDRRRTFSAGRDANDLKLPSIPGIGPQDRIFPRIPLATRGPILDCRWWRSTMEGRLVVSKLPAWCGARNCAFLPRHRQSSTGRPAPPAEERIVVMLVLSRKKNESIVINNDITIVVVEIRGDKVRLGVEAPKEVPVHRREVYDAIKRNAAAQNGPTATEAGSNSAAQS